MGSFEGVKICFLADKHDLHDDRIYWKMAVPLHERGAQVHYLLLGDREESGVTKEGIRYEMRKVRTFSGNPYLNFLLKRLDPKNSYRQLFRDAAVLKADIYHLHDLWINRIGPGLKALPHRPAVFYDAREPYAEDYRSQYGSGTLSRVLVGSFASWVDHWEKRQSLHYDLVIANEPLVAKRFADALGEVRSAVLFNYADLGIFEREVGDGSDQGGEHVEYDLIYCGMLTEQRGAWALLESVRLARERMPGIRVLLLGRIDPPALKARMEEFITRHSLGNQVEIREQVPYEQVARFYRKSRIGLILWQPEPNLKIKMPIKLFEYMAFGLPVVGSDFGHIGRVIDSEGCGISVDPESPEEIAGAIELLLAEDGPYEEMSRKGKEATHREFSWAREFERLLGFYEKALATRKSKHPNHSGDERSA